MFHRRRFDVQPTNPVAVMLASDGQAGLLPEGGRASGRPFVVRTRRGRDDREDLRLVVRPAPSRASADEGRAGRAPRPGSRGRSRALQAGGASADGQVAATRRAAKKLAAVARARGASVIVIDETTVTNPLRRLIEGDVGAELRRKLRKDGVDGRGRAARLAAARPDLVESSTGASSGARRGPMPRENR